MVNGGENTEMFDKRIIFALIISLLLLFSVSCAFAVNNETISEIADNSSTIYGITHDSDVLQMQDSDNILAANNNVIHSQALSAAAPDLGRGVALPSCRP